MPRDFEALLRKHLPVLAIFPQNATLNRPGAPDPGWGDYNPCSVEFFLSRVRLRDPDTENGYQSNGRIGLADLRERLRNIDEDQLAARTLAWELDLDLPEEYYNFPEGYINIPEEIPNELRAQWLDIAWNAYGAYLQEEQDPYQCVTYGRAVESQFGIGLQYWYLYAYNDFRNNHEGDWENVTIRLDSATEEPEEIRATAHQGSYRTSWTDPELLKANDTELRPDGSRPVIRVGRGCHSGYFGYHGGRARASGALLDLTPPRGENLVDFFADKVEAMTGREIEASLRWTLKALARAAEWLGVREAVYGLVDNLSGYVPEFRALTEPVPAVPGVEDVEDSRFGQLRFFGGGDDGELRIMPEDGAIDPEGEWWWMRYKGLWGSQPRFNGRLIPGGTGAPCPWTAPDLRWPDPAGWAKGESWGIDGTGGNE